jgi:hypothetical protein
MRFNMHRGTCSRQNLASRVPESKVTFFASCGDTLLQQSCVILHCIICILQMWDVFTVYTEHVRVVLILTVILLTLQTFITFPVVQIILFLSREKPRVPSLYTMEATETKSSA